MISTYRVVLPIHTSEERFQYRWKKRKKITLFIHSLTMNPPKRDSKQDVASSTRLNPLMALLTIKGSPYFPTTYSLSRTTIPMNLANRFPGSKRTYKQFSFLFLYNNRRLAANIVPDKPQLLTPYGTWAHYILSNDRRDTTIYHNGITYITQGFTSENRGCNPSTVPLLLFAQNPDVNDLATTPDVSISNLKIFYRKFTEAEAQKLYAEEIGTLSVSSEDIVHILYVVQVSDPSDPNILVECVARGPGKDMVPSITWFIVDADGINYSALDQSGLEGHVYTELVSDNYRIKSALQLINYGGNASVVCEAVDDATGARKASRSELCGKYCVLL
nr:uncharacterized protein LOC129280043 [Lytechinus pictus]